MQDVIIVGAGGFGREALWVIESINRITPTWNVLGFIDDNLGALDGFALNDRVLGTIKDWQPSGDEQYVLAIAAPKVKEKLVPVLKARGARFATVIDPTATIRDRTVLGEGVIIFNDVVISVDVTIGDFVFFNGHSAAGHDAVVGDYCTFGPRVSISGATKIGKCVNIGASGSTYPGITVGDYATIGMNSAAIRRVKPNTTVMGVPATAL